MKLKPPSYFHTSISTPTADYDDVLVQFDYQPAESDTNTPEGADICSATRFGEDICDELAASKIKELECEAVAFVNQWWADYYDLKAEAQAAAREDR